MSDDKKDKKNVDELLKETKTMIIKSYARELNQVSDYLFSQGQHKLCTAIDKLIVELEDL